MYYSVILYNIFNTLGPHLCFVDDTEHLLVPDDDLVWPLWDVEDLSQLVLSFQPLRVPRGVLSPAPQRILLLYKVVLHDLYEHDE